MQHPKGFTKKHHHRLVAIGLIGATLLTWLSVHEAYAATFQCGVGLLWLWEPVV